MTALANAGVAVEMRQALAGHSTPDQNETYTHRDIEVKRKAVGLETAVHPNKSEGALMKATPNERRLAQMVASMITFHRKLWQRAGRAKGSERDWERFYEQQSNRENTIGCYICNFSGGNPARFFRN